MILEMAGVMVFSIMGAITSCVMTYMWDLFWVWVLVETMIFLVMPFLSTETTKLHKEGNRWLTGVTLYFLVQCLSVLLILSGLTFHTTGSAEVAGSRLMCAGYSLKLGLFPFNFWVKRSFESFNYTGLFIAGFGQKAYIIAVMPFFHEDTICESMLYFSTLVSMLYGSVAMFSATEVKVFLGYLSMNFTGVLMLCSHCGLYLVYLYAAIYCVSLFFLILILLASNCEYVKDLGLKIPSYYKIGFICLSISLSGLPPFTDFFVKEKMLDLLWWGTGLYMGVIVLLSSLFSFLGWARVMAFVASEVKEALTFKGSTTQNLFNITCVILSLFSGVSFGMLAF